MSTVKMSEPTMTVKPARKTKNLTFVIFQDKLGYWRWDLRAANGRIIADGSEGYNRKRGAVRAVTSINARMFPPADVHYGTLP